MTNSIFSPTPIHTYLQKAKSIQTHQNLKEKLQIGRLLKLVLKSKVSADPTWAIPHLRDLVDPF